MNKNFLAATTWAWLTPPFGLANARPSKDAPEAIKKNYLMPFFRPAPTKPLELDQVELRDYQKKKNWQTLRGFIEVTPPPGECLTIERNIETPDTRVCKKTTLTFRLSELDRSGRISWRVKTKADVTGTVLEWQTPYRVASGTPYLDDDIKNDPKKASLVPPSYFLILSCQAYPEFKDRRVVLKIVDGTTWIIRLPEKDVPLALAQPVEEKKQEEKKDEKKEEAHAEEKKDADHNKEKSPEKKAAPAVPSIWQDREMWSIPRKHAFEMNAAYFQPLDSPAASLKGTCRYSYQGSKDDPHTGRLECHNGLMFQDILIPVTCLNELKSME